MGNSLFGHGVVKCACGTILQQCRCAEHQDMEFEVLDQCSICAEAKPSIEAPSILATAIAAAKIGAVLELGPEQLRGVGATDLGLLLLASQVHLQEQLLEQARKNADDFKKALNWARNEFEK